MELAAVVFALKLWRHYLYGTKCQLFTDHKSLKYIFDQPNLNMRQQRAMELIKDYDCEILYHPGKANVVADALSRNPIPSASCRVIYTSQAEPSILEDIRARQLEALTDEHVKTERMVSYGKDLTENDRGLKVFKTRIWVPKLGGLRNLLLEEAHKSKYTVHPGITKMYRDLKKDYWWPGLKKDVSHYVGRCLTCLQVKAEHQKPYGSMQPLPVPEWKWDHITMDFVTKLPVTLRKHDAIWVIVDRLTKSAHFLAISDKYSLERLAQLYINEIVTRHGIPKSIVSDRDARFTSQFWSGLQKGLGTQVKMSTAYHPETDGQTERTNQTMEDMLRACVIDFGGNWDDHLPLVEFAYNNSYHASIGMPPFEALYGRKCRTPTCWHELREEPLAGPDLLQITQDKIEMVRERIKAAQSRQKAYHDKRRKDIEFQVGDLVFLKVSPWKGVMRFGKRGKLSPRYVGPFPIVARVGTQAYKLELPEQLSKIHNVFHVGYLRKCTANHIEIVPLSEVQLDERLTYVEEPEAIMDTKISQLRNKSIKMVLVKWKHTKGPNWTWELESEMRDKYPHLFSQN